MGRLAVLFGLTCLLLGGCVLHGQQAAQAKAGHTGKEPALASFSADYLYLAAQSAIQSGNAAMAIQLLREVVKKDPEAVAPRLDLASMLAQAGRLDEAEQHLAALQHVSGLQGEEKARARVLYARSLAMRGSLDRALQELDLLQKESPDLEEGYLLRAQIQMQRRRMVEALAALNEGLRRHPASERLLLAKARLLLGTGNASLAEAVLHFLLQKNPDNVQAILLLGDIAIQDKRMDEAERLYRDFLERNPRAVSVGMALGRLLVMQQRRAEAIEVYRALAARTGDAPLLLKTLGMLYMQEGDYAAAEKAFRKAYLQAGKDNELVFFLASSLELQGRLDEARRWYAKVGKSATHYVDAQLRLSVLDIQQKHPQEAERRLRALLHSHAEKWKAWDLFIGFLVDQKRYQEALRESDALAHRDDVPNEILYSRAIALEALHRYQEMESTLRRILERDPNHAEALNFLGYSMADRGVNLDEAVELVKRALKIRPDDPYYLDSLAWAWFKQGKINLALPIQRKAVSLRGDDPVMFEHLGDMLAASGNIEEAIRAYKKALDMGAEHPGEINRKIRALK
ncbi:MAG: hypothetical protein D6703_06675 [Zetaproteobacteria bacterium]|nr:MAG: hypothetical protein D6703_06675 [Zetaproteobacteria bacterium]